MKGYIFGMLVTLPMKEFMEQLMLTGNEFFFIGILIQFLRIELSPELKTDHKKLESQGKILIILYILMLSFNAGIALLAVFRSLKELCAKKKEPVDTKEGGLAKVMVKRRIH